VPKHWVTYEEPDRDVAVAHWTERDIAVVFPLAWARARKPFDMLAIANERITSIEGRTQKRLEAGSVLLAFSRHVDHPDSQKLNPDLPRQALSLI
jgi:hypothetical protein